MKKTSISSKGSNNRLSYLDTYEEISKHQKKTRSKGDRKSLEHNREVVLSRKVRWFLFTIFIFLQILMNVDHGTFPAATDEIRTDLSINDDILGVFGSLVFLGNLVGIIF